MNHGQPVGFRVGGRCRSFLLGFVFSGAALLATPALSGPQGGVVRGGEAGIHSAGSHTLITQGTERAIIDWRSFDLGARESVRFEQPSAGSATLNRVGRGPASQINGRIDANGQVFIVNPAGVIFGRSASVNVSGLLATSANLDDRDFLQGRLDFSQPGQAGAQVRNHGQLSAADGGFIALVAPQVRNDGLIGARLGRVALASGERFTLDLSGDRLVQFALSDQQTQRLENHGEINADGGSVVLLSAASARRVVDDVVNLDGVVRADTVAQRDGRIILGAADSRAQVGGTLQAAGGTIELRAAELDLDGATLDVSSADGGGTLHVGGGWQGGGEGPRAQRLSVSADTRLRADATAAGDGGEVVLWSDGTTGFGGAISARGGPQGGDGGRVEVSGKRLLDFAGTVDARAPAGRAGHLLLDPLDMDIRALDAGNISRILRTGMSVSLLAERDLTVNAAIDGRGNASGGALSLQAGRDLTVNDFIVTNDGAIDLLAGNTVRFAAQKAVFAGGAPIRVDAGGLLSSGVLLTSGTLDLRSSTGPVHIDAPVDPSNGTLRVEAAADIQVNAPLGNLQSGADVRLSAGGDIVIAAAINGLDAAQPGGQVALQAAGSVFVDDFIVTSDGAVDIIAGGQLRFAADKAIFAGTAPIDIVAGGLLAAGATVSSGPVSLRSLAGSVELNAAVEAANGDLSVVAANDILVNAALVNLQSGSDIALQAGRDIALQAPINGVAASTPGGRVTLDAAGDIRIDESIATADGEIAIVAGGQYAQAATAVLSAGQAPLGIRSGGTLHSGALSSQQQVSLQSSTGDIVLGGLVPQDNGDLLIEAAGDVRIAQPIANLRAGSRVDISAGGDLLVAAQIDGLGAVQAGEVQLQAGGDVLLRDLIVTTLAPIKVNAGGRLEIAAQGGVYAESAAVLLRAVGELLQAGSVFSGLSLLLNSRTASVLLNSGLAPAGQVTVDAAQDLRVNAALTSLAGGEPLQLVAGRDVVINSPVDGRGGVAGGTLGISAGRNLDIAAALLTNNAAIDLQAGGRADLADSDGLFAGNGAIRLETVGELIAGPVSTSGAVTLVSRGAALRTTGDIAAGSLRLESARDLRIGRSAVSSGTLTASAGGNLAVAAPIQGSRVDLDADGSVDLGARVLAGRSLSVSGGAIFGSGGLYSNGSLSVSSAASYTTGTLSARSSLSVASGGTLTVSQAVGGLSGGVRYRAGGDLNLNAPIADLGGLASLSAGGDVRLDGRIDGLSGGLRIDAGGDILVNQDVVTDNSAIELNAGGTIIQLADGVDLFGAPQTVQLRAGNAPISETAGATISLGSLVTSGAVSVTSTGGDILVDVPIYETTGFTRLSAAGDIRINQVIANATTGADLALSAGGDIRIDAKVGPWDRSDATYPVAGRDALPGGSIEMIAAGDILIGAEIATFKDNLSGDVARLALTSSAGSVDFSGVDLRVMSDFGEVAISSFADLANGPALADVNAEPTTGYYTRGLLSLQSTGGDVVIDRLIPEETGSVLISAFDQVRVNQRIYSDGGDITILAGDGGIIQNRTGDPNPDSFANTGFISDIDAAFGDLYLQASGDILPSSLRTGSRLTIVSTAGAISGGGVDLSRAGADGAFPDTIELAGFTGIDGFNAANMRHLRALSSIGSITALGFGVPTTLLLVAGLDILAPSQKLGSDARLYAGRDIDLSYVEVFDLEIATGRHFDLATTMSAQRVALAAGTDPFAAIAGTTIAGVTVPEWTGPEGPGNITIGSTANDIIWVGGVGGFVATATGNITLPKAHVGYLLSGPGDLTDPLHTSQPFTLSAGGNVLVPQIETIGPVTVTSSDGDITIESTIGAHVSKVDPPVNAWNPFDLGVASLLLRADSGNITMREARAEGDITIAAPNGQLTFVGGRNGIEAGGSRSVTDSDGLVAVSDTIDTAEVPRLLPPLFVAPAVSPGPTLAGPGAPALPGALPPSAPAGVSVASLSASAVDLTLATPGTNQVSATTPTGIDGGGPGAPGGIDVGSRTAPVGGADDFGEIFVADNSQAAGDTVDPVRVDTRRSDDEPLAGEDESGPTQDADRLAQQGDDAVDAIDVVAGGEAEQDPQQEGDSALQNEALIAGGSAQDEEDEEEERDRREAADAAETMVVFAGGRGDARERDFGFGLPYEDGRVRP